jgi:hydrogenase-4 component C
MNVVTLIIIGVIQTILLLLAAPLFSGFSRVLRAKMHSRKGPPLMQNYRDIVKLMKRSEVISQQAGWIFRLTPYLTMACMLLIAIAVPVLVVKSPLGVASDIILLIYLFALPRFFFAISGLETGNTFGGIGARRELLLAAMIEPVLLLVVFIIALLAGSTNLGEITTQIATGSLPLSMAFLLGLAAFAFATFVEMGKLPFDVCEAEQEVQEGPLAEYSGPSLAIMKWAIYLKQLVLVALFIALFLPWGAMTSLTPLGIVVALLAFFLKAVIFYFVAGILENAMARARFMKAPAATWLALGAAVLSFVFYLANV